MVNRCFGMNSMWSCAPSDFIQHSGTENDHRGEPANNDKPYITRGLPQPLDTASPKCPSLTTIILNVKNISSNSPFSAYHPREFMEGIVHGTTLPENNIPSEHGPSQKTIASSNHIFRGENVGFKESGRYKHVVIFRGASKLAHKTRHFATTRYRRFVVLKRNKLMRNFCQMSQWYATCPACSKCPTVGFQFFGRKMSTQNSPGDIYIENTFSFSWALCKVFEIPHFHSETHQQMLHGSVNHVGSPVWKKLIV